VSRRRLERLVNLTIALMATSRPLTVADIAATVPGYDEADPADDAFRRMFERDKESLREQGIPLVTEPLSVWDDSEVGYRVRRRDYALPDLHLDPDEAAAVALAARLWQSATLAGGASSALRKLAAGGTDVRAVGDLGTGLAPRVDASDPAFEPLLSAARARRAVRFAYRRPGDAEPRERTVEPWGVVSWHGHWYLVGHDRDRGAERVFRLDRVRSEVTPTGPPGAYTPPAGVDLSARVAAAEPAGVAGVARLRAAHGSGWVLRRTASEVEPGPDGDVLTVPYADLDRLADTVAGLSPEVVALDPPALVSSVVRRLEAVLS